MFALIAMPVTLMMFSFFMCAGGVFYREESYLAKQKQVPSSAALYLIMFLASIALQLLPFYAAFYLRHSLETLTQGLDPLPQTLYSSTMTYGGLGHKIFFWVAMAWCLLMVILNIATLFITDKEVKQDTLRKTAPPSP